MWKYVNPGYSELLDDKTTTTKSSTYNPTNGVSIVASNWIENAINLPNLTEVYVKFDIGMLDYDYDDYFNFYVFGDGKNIGVNRSVNGSGGVQILDDAYPDLFSANRGDKYSVFMHVKCGLNGAVEIYLNGGIIKAYSGPVAINKLTSIRLRAIDSFINNIIVADHDIRDESVLVVPLGEPTGTWSGISDGEAKATEADQVLTQSLKIDDIKNTVGTDTVTSVSVAAYDIRYDSKKVNAMEASITKDGSNLTSATKSITNNAITPVAFMKNMTIDNLANTSVSFKAKKV